MKHKKLTIVFIVIVAFLTIFIWGNSCLSKTSSSNQSSGVMKKLESILLPVANLFNIDYEFFIRKLAHFTEFFILALACTLGIVLTERFSYHNMFHTLFYGLFVAVIDESIQILSHRGPQVQDILIDFLGVLLAHLIIYLIYFIKTKRKKKDENL